MSETLAGVARAQLLHRIKADSESRPPETRHAAALAHGRKGFPAGARLATGTPAEE
jgi:hypothetical protein